MTNQKLKIIVILILGFVLFPATTFAAILYLEPSQGQYHQGDTFVVEARIDTEEECINTVEVNLGFSQDILGVVDFSQGNSILTLWVKSPEIDQEVGLISFVGGIPGGYCGKVPGDPGKSNLLGRIVFQVRQTPHQNEFGAGQADAKLEHPEGEPSVPYGAGETEAKIEFLESSQVLLNDGLGTLAKLTTKGAVFTILPEKKEAPIDEWQEELEKDNILPESFETEIHQTPAIFEGKYFIIFSTTDKQTGIDYYEVKEGKKDWKKGESPYLLDDQGLKSIIKVKAIDKAGNERIAEYIPEKPFPYWIIIIIIVGLVIIAWRIRKFLISKS